MSHQTSRQVWKLKVKRDEVTFFPQPEKGAPFYAKKAKKIFGVKQISPCKNQSFWRKIMLPKRTCNYWNNNDSVDCFDAVFSDTTGLL